jgi:hypothetical protein
LKSAILALFALLAVASPLGAQPAAAVILGTITDQTGGALPGAAVELRSATGGLVQSATSDPHGRYRFDHLAPGLFVVEITLANFSSLRRTAVTVAAGSTRTVDAVLSLTLSADVTVTGESLVGVANTATQGVVAGRQIASRPIMRAGEVLETVPGLVISQHSGEGKANQYYLRGFNLDHGTDFATTVAGVPVNMPTHAHGHGYSDVNFLIPELVNGVQFNKGPYSPEEGDFSTAGAAHIHYTNAIDRPLIRTSAGADGWGRVLAAASTRLGTGRVLAAVEAGHHDGPWQRPDDYRKLNGVVRYSRVNSRNVFSVTGMGYTADWNATDQAPVRAIDSGLVARFGGIDDTTGGLTSRYSLSTEWQRSSNHSVTRATAYALRYQLNLFSNFTYFLDDPANGDQFEQADRRDAFGGRLSHRQTGRLLGRPSELTAGFETRRDNIGTVGLFHTVARRRLSTTRLDSVEQSSAGAFAQHQWQPAPWIRTNVGLRADRFQFDVTAGDPRNGGQESAGLVSPKAAVVIGPWRRNELYVNWGYGFHSNDARGTTITIDPATGDAAERVTPLVRARGREIGFRSMPMRGVQTSFAAWRLDLDSELLFVGDAGTTEAGRPSRRHGIEWTTVVTPASWLTLDLDLALSRARFQDEDAAGDRIPGAVGRVVAAGLTVENAGPIFGSLRLRHFGARDLIENGSVRSDASSLFNAQVGTKLSSRARLVFDAFNVLDAKVSDIDYFYTSRLHGEAAGGVDDVHTHPALPRTIRLSLQLGF